MAAGALTTRSAGAAATPSAGSAHAHPGPYLSGNFAPVTKERTSTELPVRGRLPEALRGAFIRNGPNPVRTPRGNYSWFGGDGMLHIVELDAGRAAYRNRWVRTPVVAAALGEPPPAGPLSPTGIDLSNTNTARLGPSLLSVTEDTLPYEVGLDGSTIARTDLGGRLSHGLSAHAKEDPHTGEVHQIAYRVNAAPYVVWQVIDRSGAVTSTVPLDIADPVMIHTCTLTPSHVLVYDLPVVFSPAAVAAGWSVPFAWDPRHRSRLGIIERAGGSVEWIDLPPLWVFHDAGSWDTPDGVTVDLVTYPRVFDGDLAGPLAGRPRLERWAIDTTRGQVTRSVLDDRPQEFPRVAPGTFGRRNRYTYSVAAERGNGFAALGLGNAVVRRDDRTGATVRWSPGAARSTGEAVFVADPARHHTEDGGWLLCFVFDATRGTTTFEVLDAEALSAGPVATVELPQRVPEGFHGNWYPLA